MDRNTVTSFVWTRCRNYNYHNAHITDLNLQSRHRLC